MAASFVAPGAPLSKPVISAPVETYISRPKFTRPSVQLSRDCLTKRQEAWAYIALMSALPPKEMRAMRKTAAHASEPLSSLANRWADMHSSSAQLAKVAALAPEPFDDKLAAFPNLLEGASDWQRDMAWQGIEDIDAMMRPGLAALGTITARGQDASAPALALWREFHHAREAVLTLVQPAAQPDAG